MLTAGGALTGGGPGLRRAVAAAVVVAMMLPVVRNRDGLPFSTYPMYAGVRSNEVLLITAVGVTDSGQVRTLSMLTIADTRDPLIAQSYLNDAVARGDTEAVCAAIADRSSGVAVIEIAGERHDTIKRLRGQPSLLGRELHSSCPTGR